MKWRSSSLYKVKAKFNPERFSQRNLIYNYMPLIGHEAFTVYMFLFAEATNGITSAMFLAQDRFRKFTNFSKEEIILAISKLELFSLVEIFYDEEEDMVMYILHEPLELDYLEQDFISNYLVSKLGLENSKINETFLSTKLMDKYTDGFESQTQAREVWFNINKTQSRKVLNLNIDFDLKPLLELFDQNDIDYSWLDEAFEKNMIDSIVIYQLSLLDVYLIIENLMKQDLPIEFKTYFSEIKKYKKIDLLWIDKILGSEVENIGKIKLLETLTPMQFIPLRLKRNVNLIEEQLIQTLKGDYGLSNPQINLLIDFSLIKNDQRIVTNYITKIARTITEQNINEVVSLVNFLSKQVDNPNSNSRVYEFDNKSNNQNNRNKQDVEEIEDLLDKYREF